MNQIYKKISETPKIRRDNNKGNINSYNAYNAHNARNDHLKDGIGNYIYTKQFKYINPLKFVNKSDYNKIKYENNDYNISQRVLIPDKNTLIAKPKNKKFFSMEKNLRHTTDGTYQSLINRTPANLPIKGRKKINLSFDDNSRQDHDLFLRGKVKERNKGRLFGVERKLITKNRNAESTIPEYKFGRKPFLEKHNVESIIPKNISGRKHFFDKEIKTSLY